MNPCELNITVSAIACAIAKDKTPQQISLLSALFVQLGDSLATIAAAGECDKADSE